MIEVPECIVTIMPPMLVSERKLWQTTTYATLNIISYGLVTARVVIFSIVTGQVLAVPWLRLTISMENAVGVIPVN